MPRCGCAGSSCTCLVQGGTGIGVEGAGTADNPYIITATGDADISGTVQFIDTDTVNFTVSGEGTLAQPYQVRADVTMGLDDLTDVDTATTPPTTNYVLSWNGTAWVPAPPNTVDPGSLSVTEPITGDGTTGDPLGLDLVTDWTLAGAGTATDPLHVATTFVAGTAATGDIGGTSLKTTAVTLPAGMFDTAPAVVLTLYYVYPHFFSYTASGVTTSSFNINVYNNTGQVRTGQVGWHAALSPAGVLATLAAPLAARSAVGAVDDAVVTCPTAGCVNQGIAVPIMSSWDEDGDTGQIDQVLCGVCGTDLTDTIVPMS
jgi:hypothetical protein